MCVWFPLYREGEEAGEVKNGLSNKTTPKEILVEHTDFNSDILVACFQLVVVGKTEYQLIPTAADQQFYIVCYFHQNLHPGL